MNTRPPAPTIAIAKTIQGIATTTRAVVSDISGISAAAGRVPSSAPRRRPARLTMISGSSGSSSNRASGLGTARFLGLALTAAATELERGRVEVLEHRYLAPKRLWRASYSSSAARKASRLKSGQSSSRKTNSE